MTITPEFAVDWVAALNDLEDIHRASTANVGTYSYKFATLDQITKQARHILGAHNCAVTQDITSDAAGSVSVITTVWHTSGESIVSQPFTMSAKGGPQDVGSAISYARRYHLLAFLGLATDDDDGAGAQKASTQQASEFAANVAEAKRVFELVKMATDDQKQSVKAHAADHDRKVSMAELQDAGWRAEIEELVTG